MRVAFHLKSAVGGLHLRWREEGRNLMIELCERGEAKGLDL